AGLCTVITPSCTFQPAGDPSFTFSHSSSDVPSKSTMASDGGSASVFPGVTMGGSGSHTSVSFGLGFAPCCATTAVVSKAPARKAHVDRYTICVESPSRVEWHAFG